MSVKSSSWFMCCRKLRLLVKILILVIYLLPQVFITKFRLYYFSSIWLFYSSSVCFIWNSSSSCGKLKFTDACKACGHLTISDLYLMFDPFNIKLKIGFQSNVSRIRRNLFIHKARIPARRFSSSTSQHFKMFPPFASNEGYSASGLRYQSDGA